MEFPSDMDIYQLPGEIVKVSSMAHRAVRIVADSQEELSDAELAKAMGMLGKQGWFTFSPEVAIKPEQLLDLPKLQSREEDEKSPAVRLRAVIYLLGKQKGEKDDELFYYATMEKLIEWVKEKLV